MICSDCDAEMKSFVNTHTGNHASKKSCSIAARHIGTLLACLYMTVFHAMIFGTAARRS